MAASLVIRLKTEQYDGEARRQDVAGARFLVNRHFTVKEIEEGEQHEIKHACAQGVADCDVRRVSKGHRRNPGREFRQRGDGRDHDHADPGSAELGLLGDHVSVTGKLISRDRDRDRDRANKKLRPS